MMCQHSTQTCTRRSNTQFQGAFLLFLATFLLFCAPSPSPSIFSFVSSQSVGNSFITVEVGLDICQNPSKFILDDIGDMYLLCSNGIIQKAGDMVYLIHNSTNCSPYGSIAMHPVTRQVFASCRTEGIFMIDGVEKTVVVNSTRCLTGLSFAEGTIANDFLIAACDQGGVMRINTTSLEVDVLRNATECIGTAAGVAYYSENGHDFVVGSCIYPYLFRMNMTDRSWVEIDTSSSPCGGASSITRESATGILWASCYLTGGVVRVNGTTAMMEVSMNDCETPSHIRYDPQTDVKYVTCASGTIAISDGKITPLVKLSQCPYPYVTLGINGAILLSCISAGVLRMPTATVSLAVSDSSCSVAQAVVVNRATGAIISSCASGIILTENNVDTRLVNSTDCSDGYFTELILRNGYLFARCAGDMVIIFETVTYRELRRIDMKQECGSLEGYYPDPSFDTIYLYCRPPGLLAYNMTSGRSRHLLPFEPYGTSFSVVKDTVSNSLYISYRTNGLVRYDLGSGNVSLLINDTSCPDIYSSVVGANGIVYANCLFTDPRQSFIFVLNGSSFTRFTVDSQCQTFANAFGYNPVTHNLLVSCTPDAGIFAANVVTNVWTSIVSIDQCPFPSLPFQDSTTQSVYVPCGQLDVIVSSQDFKCQPGSCWTSSGMCVACSPQTHRSYGDLLPFGKCIPCLAGYVAAAVGSTYCTPCDPGTYESKKTCLLCSPGKYQPSNASTTCIDCPVGQYAIHPGSTACTMCDPGFYAETNGTVSCSPCNSGSASNITGLDRPCDGCPAGSYQAGIGQTSCFTCPDRSYSEQSNSTSCTRCADYVNDARTTCTFVVCDANSQFNDVANQCDLCPLSQYSSRGGLCTVCNVATYTPGVGSGCAPCNGVDGLLCTGGIAQVMPGYWAYISHAPEARWPPLDENWNASSLQPIYQLYRTVRCPFCLGTTLQLLPASNSSSLGNASAPTADGNGGVIQYCAFPRLNSVNNTLCSQCEVDYLAWGDHCISCKSANGGLIFAYLVLSFALVLFLFYSASNASSAGSMSILLFYVQTASLEMGPVVQFLDWIQVVVNLDPKSAGSCLAPWSAYGQTLFALFVPIILIGELMIIALIHYTLFKLVFGNSVDNSNHDLDVSSQQQVDFSTKVSRFFIVRLSRFSIDDYYVGVLAILLFCYTQVSTASFSYLQCVDIEEERLNFSAPTIDCKSTEYKHYLIPVILAIILYIVGLPLGAGFKLWRNRQSLYIVPETPIASNSTQAFLRHWSPMYAMYRAEAWFWQCWVLLRRAAFVVTAVLLMQQNSYRFMVFAFLHFASLLLHLYVRPYEADNLNRMETVSYVLLVSMSLLLTGITPPYSLGIQLLLFAIVVPPSLWMVGDVVMQRYQTWRKNRSERSEMKKQDDARASAKLPDDANAPAVMTQSSHPSPISPSHRDIELSSVSTGASGEQNQHQVNDTILPPYALSDSEQQF